MNDNVYRIAVETMRDGMLVVDTTGTILAVNPAFGDMTGYSSRELVGKRCTILNCTGCKIFGEQPGSVWCALFMHGGVRQRKCELSARDGRTIHVVKHASVLHDESGKATCAVETLSDVTAMVQQAEQIRSLKSTLCGQTGLLGMVGASEPMQNLRRLIENVARSEAPVFIHGESGVGKELVALALHELAGRSEKSFIRVNCASLNENLLESELFGHVKGAFTGADRDRVGRFEAAEDGSIFLDEIGDISHQIQVKLLRVLESKEVERVGDHRPIPVQARIITATNKNLDQLVAEKLFREDLFYRINVVPIRVPPLRERKDDIPLLVRSFIEKFSAQGGKRIHGVTPAALEAMMAYDWPGNIRELRNAIEYAFVLCSEDLIDIEDLATRLGRRGGCPCGDPAASSPETPAIPKDHEELLKALSEAGGNQSRAAKILGVSRVTVWKKMKKYGVSPRCATEQSADVEERR